MLRQCLLSAAVFALLGAAPAHAQSGPPAGLDLSGKWTLDTYLSDTPEEIAAAIRYDFGNVAGTELFALEPEGGRGQRGGAPQGGRGRNQRGGQREQPTAEQQNQVNELTAPLRYPPATMTIAQAADRITFTDDQGQTRTLTTSGAREKQSLGSVTVDAATSWQGPQLVSVQDLGKGRKVTFTYSIVPTTKQLMIRARLERGPGESGPFDIKYVYNRAGE